ncbi:MAG TPA: hypothetical protein ENH85_00665, partial [Candidatus Scalindua sp.]|nr:hypothetical protein [Candidatus Scalindua sp.]
FGDAFGHFSEDSPHNLAALVAHPNVAESAVVGFPHKIKGQGIYAYVTLKSGIEGNDDIKKELLVHITKVIGPIAKPDVIQFAPSLPKTRSGKIMRRILRKVAEGVSKDLGDTSTLADPSVVAEIVDTAMQVNPNMTRGRRRSDKKA